MRQDQEQEHQEHGVGLGAASGYAYAELLLIVLIILFCAQRLLAVCRRWQWRRKLVAFYTQHNPSKLRDVDKVLARYRGQEKHLFEDLERKYLHGGHDRHSSSAGDDGNGGDDAAKLVVASNADGGGGGGGGGDMKNCKNSSKDTESE